MLTGIRYQAKPTAHQAEVLSQWIGCARVIWNAKCDEEAHLRSIMEPGVFPKSDKAYSHFKTAERPWLKNCPSQILRNSATIWHKTFIKFLEGVCGRPRRKKKHKGNYIWLTRELFELRQDNGRWQLLIGTKTKNLGELEVNWHRQPKHNQLPSSIWIRVTNTRWTVSFSYEDGQAAAEPQTPAEHLKQLSQHSEEELLALITPLDRGIARPVQTDKDTFKPDERTVKKQKKREKHLKRLQRKLARQVKGSKQRKKTLKRIGKAHAKTANVRSDFMHKTSKTLVDGAKVIVMEDLKLSNMTRRPKPIQCPNTGRWLRNNASAKSGLNRALLGTGLGMLETFITYKAARQNKPVFKINPVNTSRECAACGHIHPDNRASQAVFRCLNCGHQDNADRNAAIVIRKRAIKLIKHSGIELVGRYGNVLRPGAGANSCKTREAQAKLAANSPSKKNISPSLHKTEGIADGKLGCFSAE